MKILLMIVALVMMQTFAASAQDDSEKTNDDKKEIAVPVVKQAGSLKFRCIEKPGVFKNHYELESRVDGNPNCLNPIDLLKVDFDKQTLIGYRASGDCLMRARAGVFRNDETKTYRVGVVIKSGECRAVGNFQGWIVVDKILEGYKVEFSESKIDDKEFESELFEETLSRTEEAQEIKLRKYEMNRCISFIRAGVIIKSQAALLERTSNNAARKECLDKLEKIDFKKESLLGITIYSGYCRYPNGLEYSMMRDDRRKSYTLLITYDDPYGRTCRALGIYDLWLAFPKPPDDYEIKIEVASVLNKKYEY